MFTIAGIIAVFLILVFLGSYFYFYVTNKKLAQDIQRIKDSSSDLDKTITENEAKLSVFQRSIDDFVSLISSHKNIGQVFDFINKNTIPAVWFNGFVSDDKDSNGFIILGKTSSFFLIEQQISVFKKQGLVVDAKLKEININKEKGAIEYSIAVIFKPEIFVYNPPEQPEQPQQ